MNTWIIDSLNFFEDFSIFMLSPPCLYITGLILFLVVISLFVQIVR